MTLNALPPEPPDDATLIAQIVQRQSLALSQLYDRYARLVYSVAYRSLNSVEESEELVMDVFSQVWRLADRYDGQKARVDTWIMMMARSRILDRLRNRQRFMKTTTASVEAEIQSTKTSVDPMEEASLSERRTQVLTALSQLPPEQRQVIELAYYSGLSHREIAAQTDLSLGTVKTRIRLGLSKLQAALGAWQVDINP
jgi:RNA polymerase sigma factor (sigma-70 family)